MSRRTKRAGKTEKSMSLPAAKWRKNAIDSQKMEDLTGVAPKANHRNTSQQEMQARNGKLPAGIGPSDSSSAIFIYEIHVGVS